MRLSNNQIKIISISLLSALAVFIFFIFTFLSSGKNNLSLNEEKLNILPLLIGSRKVEFTHTDETSNETFLIATDKKVYESFSESDVYFSVTNTNNTQELIDLQFLFSNNTADIKEIYQKTNESWEKLRIFSSRSPHLSKKSIPDKFSAKQRTQSSINPKETKYFKAQLSYLPGSKGEFWIEAMGDKGGYGLLDPWYSSSWSYRKKITINKNKISGTSNFSNFPVLISRTDTDWKHTDFGGKVASASAGITGGGGDFVFTDADGTTKIDHEIEKYASSSGELIAWVEVPTLKATDYTTVYVYYGGPSTGATNQNKTGTWDTNYKGVWHLHNSASPATDSTSNANDGTQSGGVTFAATGQLDGASQFDGADDKLQKDSSDFDGTGDVTISAWIYPTGWGEGGFGRIYVNGTKLVFFISQTNTELRLANDGSNVADSLNIVKLNQWQHVVATRPSAGTNEKFYINGVDSTGATGGGTPVADTTIVIGNNPAQTATFTGKLDEVRVSSTLRSSDWIKTEYNNQSALSSFYSVGGQEGISRTAPSLKVKGGTTIRGGIKVR